MLSYVPFALINSCTRDKNGAFALIYELSQIPSNKMLFLFGKVPAKKPKKYIFKVEHDWTAWGTMKYLC